jgi:hypothetical protein
VDAELERRQGRPSCDDLMMMMMMMMMMIDDDLMIQYNNMVKQ